VWSALDVDLLSATSYYQPYSARAVLEFL
jgi:hypothetical protein